MYQPIPAAPSTIPSPRDTAGHLSALSVPGVGHLQVLCCSGICQPRGHSQAFDTHVVSYQNINTQRILLGKKADWLKGPVKASSWFYACISSLLIRPELHSETWSYQSESTFFGHWMKFLLILFEKHPFIFIKLFITYNFCLDKFTLFTYFLVGWNLDNL